MGTNGLAELDEVTVLNATLKAFEEATRELLPLLRWEPARQKGRLVRMIVQLPVTWRIDDARP